MYEDAVKDNLLGCSIDSAGAGCGLGSSSSCGSTGSTDSTNANAPNSKTIVIYRSELVCLASKNNNTNLWGGLFLGEYFYVLLFFC